MVGGWLALACWTGCGGGGAPPPEGMAEGMAEVPSAAAPVRGILVHQPFDPGVQSVEAWLGVEFFLDVEGGGRLPLLPTEAMPADALRALAGVRVELTGRATEGSAPPPDLPAPLGPDGEPLRRGAGLRVEAARPLDP